MRQGFTCIAGLVARAEAVGFDLPARTAGTRDVSGIIVIAGALFFGMNLSYEVPAGGGALREKMPAVIFTG